MLLLLAALTGNALAEPVFTDLGFIVTPPAEGPFHGGVNAPTVAFTGSLYVMYFESLSTETYDGCAQTYTIGRATSADGLTWVLDDAPVLTPDRADDVSIYSCSVSAPAVAWKDGTYHLFFGMGDEKQDSSATINRPTGVGYATSTDGVSFTVQQAPTPIGDFEDRSRGDWHEPDGGDITEAVGMPTATFINDTLYMTYLSSTRMYAAKFDTVASTWSLWDADLSAPFTGTAWAAFGVFSPAMYCSADTLSVLVGGYTDATYVTRAAGIGTSTDLTEWTVGGALAADSVPFASINHLEVLPAGPDLLVFYSMTDPSSGKKAVGLGTTSASWASPDGRACEWEFPETGDTGGGDTDTDTDADTDTDTDTDTADSGEGDDTGADVPDDPECGCATGGSLSWVGVIGALALVRRRRSEV